LTRVTVIGAAGFVGSAFLEHLRALADTEVVAVTRGTYAQHRGRPSDVVVDCAGNSRKYLAEGIRSDLEPRSSIGCAL
jgi:nucleoside-diphosphate-sugar epimerase